MITASYQLRDDCYHFHLKDGWMKNMNQTSSELSFWIFSNFFFENKMVYLLNVTN